MSEHDPVLEVTGLTVEFPGVRALDDVGFTVARGEVHALVGENGAGKSTLLKVLGGVNTPTAGTVVLDGNPYSPAKPHDALVAGIAVIYQEFTLFPDLTVAENVFVGREPVVAATRGIRYGVMRDECRRVFGMLDWEIDPDARVGDLSVSEQQLVEIAKALSVEGQVIVMDEPTAALSHSEVARLLDVVRRLRDEGRSVIYVSHHLEEVFEIADRATVLRDGKHVATLDIASTTEDELVRHMVGREVSSVFTREPGVPGEVVLGLDGLSAGRILRDVSLDVRAGEVVGIGGVAGAGQTELTEAVYGALAARRGSMTLHCERYAPSSPADALRAGVGFLHEDRKSAGNLPHLTVAQNVTITILDRMRGVARLLSFAKERETYDSYRSRMRIKASSPAQLIGQLSGGNQQKVLLGRALAPGGDLLVLNEPTRGVDIGAKAEIHQLIGELTKSGVAVLMVSSDLPELLGMSDRVVVLSQGRVVGRLDGDERTEENVIACATTGRRIGVAA
ncbi:sugar ABC transporter ATP-binding protein [Cellulosimicrobium arenosum]|uniref:Sugar ABC transporter ATP-binding protein n=1 Tax=Cellulosimicrobium arenosum TaxID=2708133 RepID=A0A927J0Y1_9MICO|nr:sugar ABC transporter ATP-binding protein [Cellulosimicrobium arenosum]MBD8079869.1 sugar ABC transporter ATP-binding protein [Cellulosimicrobium arenosum]